jgi:hypothetical protein
MAGTLPLSVNLTFLTGEYLVLHPHFIYSPSVKFEKKNTINSGKKTPPISISLIFTKIFNGIPTTKSEVHRESTNHRDMATLLALASRSAEAKREARCELWSWPNGDETSESGRPSGIKEAINRFP